MSRAPRKPAPHRFSTLQRLLHWTTAVLVIAMLFIGVGMASSLGRSYLSLVAVHRPLGVAILLLTLLRLGVRLKLGSPPLPADLPWPMAFGAKASQVALYALLLAMPLIGWAMLSAGGYPVEMFGAVRLPPITPHDAGLHALLRQAHTLLALALFATILLHLAAGLFHALIRRDGVFETMAGGAIPQGAVIDEKAEAQS